MHDTHEEGMKNRSCVCGLSVKGEYRIRVISHSPSPEERYLSPPAGELHQAGGCLVPPVFPRARCGFTMISVLCVDDEHALLDLTKMFPEMGSIWYDQLIIQLI